MIETVAKDKLLAQAKRYLDEGRLDRAIQEYQKIVTTDPRDYRVQLRIAELYVRLKQVGTAITTFQRVAAAYADEGFYLKAVTVYKNILKLNPSLHDVNERLADLYEKMGLAQDAIRQYQILINVFEQKGDHKGMLEIRRRIVALDPLNVTNRIRLAEAYQVNGEDAASVQEYEALAEQLKDSGQREQLVELYEKIVSRRPDHLDLLLRLCRIYFEQGEYKKALRRMEVSHAVVATNAELLGMQAEMYFRQNQMETARGKWRELAELHQAAGEAEGALQACERILTVAPEEAEELAPLIEAIRPGSLNEVKARADAQRASLAREEAEREALETARQQAAEQMAEVPNATPTVGAPFSAKASASAKAKADKTADKAEAPATISTAGTSAGPVGANDIAQLENQGRAGEELGKMYEQMGLSDEAGQEYAKALAAYRRLLVAGIGGTSMLDHVRALEQKAAPTPAASPPVAVFRAPVEPPKPAVPRPAPPAPSKTVPAKSAGTKPSSVKASSSAKATADKPAGGPESNPPPAGGEKKKRISFV